MELGTKKQKEPWFLALNPYGRIPVIVDRDLDPPVVLFESVPSWSISPRNRAVLPRAAALRAEALEWLFFGTSSIGPTAMQVHWLVRLRDRGEPHANLEIYRAELDTLYAIADRRLAEAPYLAGDYSIADIAAYPGPTARHAGDRPGPVSRPRRLDGAGRGAAGGAARHEHPAAQRRDVMGHGAASMAAFALADDLRRLLDRLPDDTGHLLGADHIDIDMQLLHLGDEARILHGLGEGVAQQRQALGRHVGRREKGWPSALGEEMSSSILRCSAVGASSVMRGMSDSVGSRWAPTCARMSIFFSVNQSGRSIRAPV